MFNVNLRTAREKAGFSQTQLADSLNISVSTYRNYENTNREPDYKTLIKIANALDCSIDFLLGHKNGSDGGLLLVDEKEIELIEHYRTLDLEEKGEVRGLIRGFGMRHSRNTDMEIAKEMTL